MLFTLFLKPPSKSFLLYPIPHCMLLFLIYAFVLVRPAQAGIWLNDTVYFDNQNYLQLSAINNSSMNNGSVKDSTTNLRLLPAFSLVQNIPTSSLASKITLGSKFDLQTTNTQAIINELHLITAISPILAFTLGRQKIAYAQQDLFSTSLNKNDLRPAHLDKLTFSQGLLTTLRLGVIEQSVLLNQKDENNASIPSFHYQLKVGIPGYKIGPLKLLLSRENNASHNINNRVMLGSAVQFPIGYLTGDWQWAFQYATELNNAVDNQQAWQTSFSWLGPIPNHKVGLLFSHTDSYWNYSDDFSPNTNRTELRYQWRIQQRLTLELAASKVDFNAITKNGENEIVLNVSLGY
jgi:hypothetical protein